MPNRAPTAGALPDWLAPLLVALATFVVFLPSLQNGFVNWDDGKNLLLNRNYRGLGWSELRWMFTDLSMGHYQPLSWMSLGFDYLLWGMNPFGYHLTSLILHCVNAALCYFVALRLLRLALFVSPGETALRLAAGFSAILFAIHPLRVEAVAWATERRGLLAALFFLLSLLCYLKANEGAMNRAPTISQEDGRRLRWLALSAASYGMSLLSKASGVALPAVLLALDFFPLRRLGGGVREWFGVSRRWVWLEKIPFLLLGAAAVALAFMAEHEAGAIVEQERGVIGGLGQAMFRLAFYLWKTLVPAGLSPVYAVVGDAVPATWGIAPSERAILWLSAVIVLGLSAALFFLRRRWPAGLTCGVCYAALLLPVLGVVQVGAQIVADRYSYLPCLGLAMLAGGGAAYGWRTPRRRAVVAAIGGALILFVVSSWRQAEVWHDSERLWRHALKVGRDSARAHYNLALSLSEQGKPDEEMEHYRDALRVNPQYAQAQNNLGNMLFRRGQQEEGMALLRAALKSDPLLAEAHYGLGNMHYRRGELDEAAGHYREAVRIRPGYADAHINLALLLANQGKEPEAIEHLRRALEIDPSDARVHYNLAGMLAGQGNLDEAVAHLNQALGAEPNVAMIHETLARVLERQGKREEAIEHYREAMRLMK